MIAVLNCCEQCRAYTFMVLHDRFTGEYYLTDTIGCTLHGCLTRPDQICIHFALKDMKNEQET